MGQDETPSEGHPQGWTRFGHLIRETRKRRELSQERVAGMLSDALGRKIDQARVSSNESGSRLSPDLVPGYIEVLGLTVNEVSVALFGMRLAPESGADFNALVDNDQDLDDQSKQHLKNQYGLLRAATAYTREHMPADDHDTVRRRA